MSGLAWMTLAQLFFAAMNICTRLSARHLPWSEIAAVRFLLGALVAVAVARRRGSALRVNDSTSAWRRSLYGTAAALCTFYALSSPRIALGDVATLGATAPVFVAMLSAPLLREPVDARVKLAIVLGFAGVVTVMRPSFSVAVPVAALATIGALFYALAMIWLRKMGAAESHEAVVLHFSLTALLIFLALAVPVWHWPDRSSGLFLLGAGASGGLAQVAMTRAYSLHQAAPITAVSWLGIVLTYLLAVLILGDHLSRWQMIGTLLVIAAGAVLTDVWPWPRLQSSRRVADLMD
jgi:drug/metabolite transporter (DMT)-like permease